MPICTKYAYNKIHMGHTRVYMAKIMALMWGGIELEIYMLIFIIESLVTVVTTHMRVYSLQSADKT